MKMRRPLLLLLSLGLVAGCAGNVADYVGPRSSIVAPQLMRYGLNLRETRCVGEWLGSALTPLQLRRLVRVAASVRQGYVDPERLTWRDLVLVAGSMNDPAVRDQFARADDHCGLTAGRAAANAVPAPPSPPAADAAAARPAAWLNLGAAPTGQAIAVDASTIEEEGSHRAAWFRMTDPGVTGPSADAFLLRVDCAARTINARARRRQGPAGAVAELREYPDNPMPVEGGTVMEIAWLALCT